MDIVLIDKIHIAREEFVKVGKGKCPVCNELTTIYKDSSGDNYDPYCQARWK